MKRWFTIAGFIFLLAGLVSGQVFAAGDVLTSFLPGDAGIGLVGYDQNQPAIARGDQQSLVVWADQRAAFPWGAEYETSYDIYGTRLDAAGNPLETVPFPITQAPGRQEYPQVAWNGSNWLVVFQSTVMGGTGYYDHTLQAVRVSPSGEVLDGQPITLHGVTAYIGMWSVASDGNNWVIAYEGTQASGDIFAARISPDGAVLDPPVHSLVKATYYMRWNVRLAYAGGVFLLTFDDQYVDGVNDTKAIRFDSSLNLLDPAPFKLLNVPVQGLASSGSEFYVVWHQQQPDYSMAVIGSRLNLAGNKLDGAGDNISAGHEPQAYTTTGVVWDGSGWRVTWGFNNAVSVARVSATGNVLDPGGVSVSGPATGPSAATPAGGVQLVWVVNEDQNNNIYTAAIAPNHSPGPNRGLSTGYSNQNLPDLAAGADGYMLVYRSELSGSVRILAQPLDAAGNPRTAEPVQLTAGSFQSGPGAPAVAWNGSLYLATWGTSSGIVAQRLLPDGTLVDPAPFSVMSGFGPVDVAALGDTFLIVGLHTGYSPEHIYTIGARVRGSDGAVLAPAGFAIGGFYASVPKVVTLGERWLVAFISNWSHDESNADTGGVFVDAAGNVSTSTNLYGTFSTAGGNGIFDISLASNGSTAVLVQPAELTSGVETDLVARIINADGTLQPVVNLTPWRGNQYRPRAAWDGNQFVIVYQDQRNRTADLDMVDARSDLFGIRLSSSGVVLDPQGFLISASPVAESHPTVASNSGVSLIAAMLMRNDLAAYRIGFTLFGQGGNQPPVAVASANPAGGDVPLTVNFSAAGSVDPDGSLQSFRWEFGDGASSDEANPAHTYTTAGPFVATLTVTDQAGAQTANTVLVSALAPNQIPVANIIAEPASGPAPLAVTFSALGSYDPDGPLGNFKWQFSDGSEYWGATAYNTFDSPGTHSATLTVYDSRGAAGTATLQVTVGQTNQTPISIAAATPTNGSGPLAVRFNGSGSYDPDGTLATYRWDFGDGTQATGASPSHTYNSPGTFAAILTVIDNAGAAASSSPVTITVAQSGCKTNCLRSTAITLSATGRTTITATGKVTVKNEKGQVVSGAKVYVTWTLPNGSQVTQVAQTNTKGIAQFTTSGGRGTFTLTVTNLTKTGWTFNPANSVLSKSITR